MKKINGGYESLFDYLVLRDFPFARAIQAKLYPDENKTVRYGNHSPYVLRYNASPKHELVDKFVGSFQPMADMLKDVIDTVKPYKSSYGLKRDILQPIRGITNVAKGVAILIATPVLFVANAVRYALYSGSVRNFGKNLAINAFRSATWSLDGVNNIIRGITQVATTPLTLLIKIPLRGIITGIVGRLKIEDNAGIKRMANLATEGVLSEKSSGNYSDDRYYNGHYELHRKFIKAHARGQATNINPAEEQKLYDASRRIGCLSDDKINSINQYIGLFANRVEDKSSCSNEEQHLLANDTPSYNI
jgi:hypothetical protein